MTRVTGSIGQSAPTQNNQATPQIQDSKKPQQSSGSSETTQPQKASNQEAEQQAEKKAYFPITSTTVIGYTKATMSRNRKHYEWS
ncbi:MAG TPA: hypothetical protein VLH08_00840 [Acidobacteriota bacterium]|nr:hypothetical protein [Acidobacteriota bacterium]